MRGSRLAIILCIAVFLPLVAAGPAAALSGYASDQPAVNAQYPDAAGTGGSQASGDSDGTLKSLMVASRVVSRHVRRSSPKAAAHQRRVQRQIFRQEKGALSSAAGLTPSQSGSLVLLLGALAVVLAGGVLRWRRT